MPVFTLSVPPSGCSPGSTARISESAYSVSPPNTGAVMAISWNTGMQRLRPKVTAAMPMARCSVMVLTINGLPQAVLPA